MKICKHCGARLYLHERRLSCCPICVNSEMNTKEDFNVWWDLEGSEMRPLNNEDIEKFAHRITRIAWCNGEYKTIESRNCTNCKWYQDEVCVNDESRLCADFVSDNDICKLWED